MSRRLFYSDIRIIERLGSIHIEYHMNIHHIKIIERFYFSIYLPFSAKYLNSSPKIFIHLKANFAREILSNTQPIAEIGTSTALISHPPNVVVSIRQFGSVDIVNNYRFINPIGIIRTSIIKHLYAVIVNIFDKN